MEEACGGGLGRRAGQESWAGTQQLQQVSEQGKVKLENWPRVREDTCSHGSGHGKAVEGNLGTHSEKVEEAEMILCMTCSYLGPQRRGRTAVCLKGRGTSAVSNMASHTIASVPGTGAAQQLLVTGEVPRLLVSLLPAFCLVSVFNSSLVRIQE